MADLSNPRESMEIQNLVDCLLNRYPVSVWSVTIGVLLLVGYSWKLKIRMQQKPTIVLALFGAWLFWFVLFLSLGV